MGENLVVDGGGGSLYLWSLLSFGHRVLIFNYFIDS